MPDLIIETRMLKKNYGEKVAVDGIDLAVERGSIHGFLGRNGSGKTTTIKMLLGLTFSTSGEARVFGMHPWDRKEGVSIRQRVGFVSEDKGLYDSVKVGQMISFTRSFFPNWDREMEERLIALFELPLKQRVRELSKGMRTKFEQEAPEHVFVAAGASRFRREARSLTVFADRNVETIVDQAYLHNAVSVDVAPVTLKEIFLECTRNQAGDPK
jgi:ABC-type polar amino acid transport system ATPase subunit